jgi:hypothetical protein
MKLSMMAAIPLRQFYLYRGSAARVVPLFAWVTVDMVLWGFMTKFLGGLAQTNYRFVPALLGAVLFWDFMIRVMQGVTTSFFEDVWSRNFLNVFASPITVPEYIGGLLLTSIATSMVGLAVMVVVGPGVWAALRRLRRDADSVCAGAVFVWNGTWNCCHRDCAAAWACGRVVCMADSGDSFAFCGGLLSPDDTSDAAAMDCAADASFLCV